MFNAIANRKNPALLLTAALAMVVILLLLARTVSAAQGENNANENNQGNTKVLTQLAEVQQQISDFQSDMSSRLDTVDATLLALQARINLHDTDVSSSIGTETQEIDDALAIIHTTTDEHANPNPFTMSVNTCATLSGTGELGGELMGGLEIGADGSVGAQVGGNGIKGKTDLQGSLMAKLELLAGVEIAHTVCNAGIEVASTVEEEDYSASQTDTINGYEFTIAALQEDNDSPGGVLASAMGSPQDLVSYAGQMGLEISDIVGSIEALVQLDGLPSNPTALVTGDIALDGFADALDFGEAVDTSVMLGVFTDPCGELSGLGSVAAEICDNIDTSLVDSIAFIEGTVADVESTVDDVESILTEFVVDFPVELDAAVTDISNFVTEQTEAAYNESIAYTTQVCGDMSGFVDDLRAWDFSIDSPSFGINQGSYTINPPSMSFDVGSLGKISVNIPGFSFNPPGFSINPPAIGDDNILSGVISPLEC